MEQQFALQKEYREKQDKYIYYLIALSVAAIGFTIVQTEGLRLSKNQISLAVAVLSWSISIYCGLRFLTLNMSSIALDKVYLDMMTDADPEIRSTTYTKLIAQEAYLQKSKSHSSKGNRLWIGQEVLFFLGVIMFLVWHVIRMAYN